MRWRRLLLLRWWLRRLRRLLQLPELSLLLRLLLSLLLPELRLRLLEVHLLLIKRLTLDVLQIYTYRYESRTSRYWSVWEK